MIRGIGFNHERFTFPCGERHVRLHSYEPRSRVSLHFEFHQNEDLVELLLVANAIRHADLTLEGISMPYIPFGRQDRINVPGEPFSLEVLASVVNSCGAEVVEVVDPHSDVAAALIHNIKIRPQHDVFGKWFVGKRGFYLISPDAGALKKILKLAVLVDCEEVVECSKERNVKTGEIVATRVYKEDFGGLDCYIVDDICDGGRTFIEIAKVLKGRHCGKVVLMVTHGFFTKGLDVFRGLIDEVYTLDGRIVL